MGAVAKRFFRRGTATAKRHSFFHGKLVSVGVDQFHIALHDVRAVLDCLDCYHVRTLLDVIRAENVVEAAVSAACLSNRRLAQAPLQRQYSRSHEREAFRSDIFSRRLSLCAIAATKTSVHVRGHDETQTR